MKMMKHAENDEELLRLLEMSEDLGENALFATTQTSSNAINHISLYDYGLQRIG